MKSFARIFFWVLLGNLLENLVGRLVKRPTDGGIVMEKSKYLLRQPMTPTPVEGELHLGVTVRTPESVSVLSL